MKMSQDAGFTQPGTVLIVRLWKTSLIADYGGGPDICPTRGSPAQERHLPPRHIRRGRGDRLPRHPRLGETNREGERGG